MGAHYEDGMTLEELRDQIDALDRQLVELLSERARVMRALQRDELASERNAQAVTSGSSATGLGRGGDPPGHGAGAETPETGNKQ